MAKIIKNKSIDIYTKAKNLLEQLKVSKKIEESKKKLEEEYYVHNPNGRGYESMLKKVGLLDSRNSIIPFINAQNAYPETFCFQPKNDEIKKSFLEEESDVIFYNLVIPPKGKTILEVFRNNEKVEERYKYNDYDILLNLPYLLGKIVEEDNFTKVRKNLEKFLSDNPTCTLANLYSFAKKNFKSVNKIPEDLLDFEKKLKENGRARADVYHHSTFISNVCCAKFRNYGEKTKIIKYSIEEEASGPVLRTELDYQNYYSRYPGYKLAKFPAKILIKEKELVLLYLPASFFEDKKTKPNEDTLCLLSFEDKVKEELAAYVASGKSDVKSAEENYRKEREEEFKSIIRALKKFLKFDDSINTNMLQKQKVELLKLSEEVLQKSTDTLANLLAQLYKKEIVLNNL
jgi:hypothetical protein